MADTSAIASPGSGIAGGQSATPGYLQQQPNNPTVAGQVSNMVKALMQGQDQFKQGQQLQQMMAAKNATALNPATTTGGPPVGAPMNIQPPVQSQPVSPAAMTGSMGGPPGMSGAPQGGGMSGAPNPAAAAAIQSNPGAQPDVFNGGNAPPVNLDPMTQALFSPIPGMSGG